MKNESQGTVMRFIYSYYKTHYIYLFFIFLFSFLLGAYNVIDGFLKKSLIDSLTIINSDQISNLKKTLFKNIALIIFFYLLNHFFWRALNFIQIQIGHKIRNRITKDCFLRIQSQSFSFFQNNLSGSLSYNIFSLGENIQILVHKYFVTFARAFLQLILVLSTMYFINPIFSVILVIWIIFFLSFSIFFLKKFRIASRNYAEVSAKTSGKIVDSIANFFNIKIFTSLIFEKKKLNESLKEMEEKFKKKDFILLLINSIQGLSIAISFCFVLFFLVKLRIENSISLGELVFIISLFFHISENIWWVSEYIGLVNEIFGKCHAAMNKIFSQVNLVDSRNAKDIKILNGDIEFKDVSFQFNETSSKLFENFSIKIENRKKIGLVGHSGSGKTSFINLILRLYDVNSGSILIDGHDIRDFKQDSLRSQISVIPQDPFLFHRTILENLEYGLINQEKLSEEERNQLILDATKQANAHNFIMNLPNQYNSLVGERGVKLSGGQRQRIAIARAILKKDAPILILDEATSALDSIIESEIQNQLLNIMKDKTVLIIAHRLSTLLNVDEILVFKDGEIIERGNHFELIKKNGHYKELWDAQVDGFLNDSEEN